ncbi:hypothetical protein HMPREF3101_02515 [Corynebacterium sp. HMSC29G08]|nr:hypothetical protein HMPREF3101_02515 [Corynebacterium sp. HMSC29G08]
MGTPLGGKTAAHMKIVGVGAMEVEAVVVRRAAGLETIEAIGPAAVTGTVATRAAGETTVGETTVGLTVGAVERTVDVTTVGAVAESVVMIA